MGAGSRERKERENYEEFERKRQKIKREKSVVELTREKRTDVIEIHGSSSEDNEGEETSSRQRHKHSHKHRKHELEHKHSKHRLDENIDGRKYVSSTDDQRRREKIEEGGDNKKRRSKEDEHYHRKHKRRTSDSEDERDRKKQVLSQNVRIKEERVDDRHRSRERNHREENRQDGHRSGRPARRFRRRSNDEEDEHQWGRGNRSNSDPTVKREPVDKEKPDFKLSGKLTEDRNTYKGVVIKYSEPPEARMPKKRWRLYQFKGDETLPTLYIHRQSAYLIGRDRKVADLPVDHPSCSKQHAALQYRLVTYERANGSIGKQIRLYLIDLESANGTFINGKKIEPKKYVELLEKDVIKFGFSSREYVLLHEQSKDDELSEDEEPKE